MRAFGYILLGFEGLSTSITTTTTHECQNHPQTTEPTTQILIMLINDSHSLLWPLRDRQCMSIMLNVGQLKHCGSIVISAVAVLTVNNIRQHHPWDGEW